MPAASTTALEQEGAAAPGGVRDHAGRDLEQHHPGGVGRVRDEDLEDVEAGVEQEERVDAPDHRRGEREEAGDREVGAHDPPGVAAPVTATSSPTAPGLSSAGMAERLDPTLKAVSDAVLAVAAELSVDEVLQRLVHSARELAGARYAALGLPDETAASAPSSPRG